MRKIIGVCICVFASISLCLNSCSFRHIGSTSLYNGEQVELLHYAGHKYYFVRKLSDTTVILFVDEDKLE